jgi:MOSC domain-containing protein YiiM
MARLLSVNVGLPREITWRGKTVHTSVWKEPVQGRRPVQRLNIDGDAQGDLAGHGGEHRAVFVYQMDSRFVVGVFEESDGSTAGLISIRRSSTRRDGSNVRFQ